MKAIVKTALVSATLFGGYYYGNKFETNQDLSPTSGDFFENELKYDGEVEIPTLYQKGSDYNNATTFHTIISGSFTIDKKINSKKLIEQIATVSPCIPRFDNLGRFKMDIIPLNNPSDPVGNHLIKEDNIISFSFSRTSIDSVYSKVSTRYKYDYPSKEFLDKIGPIFAKDNFNGYEKEYYGYTEDKELVIEGDIAKFFGESYMGAKSFAYWALSYYCNQHLIIKCRLPLKAGLNIEIGDIVAFQKLLGDVRPYGIDYSFRSDTANRMINGQKAFDKFIVHKTNKTLEYVDLECTMLHNLIVTDCPSGEYDCFDICDGVAEEDLCGVCDGPCIEEGCEEVYCSCINNACNPPDCDEFPDCDGECNGDAQFDECGECGGNCNPSGGGNGNGVEDCYECPDGTKVCDVSKCPPEDSYCFTDTSKLTKLECELAGEVWDSCYSYSDCTCFDHLPADEWNDTAPPLLWKMDAEFPEAEGAVQQWMGDLNLQQSPCFLVAEQPVISRPFISDWRLQFQHTCGEGQWEITGGKLEIRATDQSGQELDIPLFPTTNFADMTITSDHLYPSYCEVNDTVVMLNYAVGEAVPILSADDWNAMEYDTSIRIRTRMYMYGTRLGVDRYWIYEQTIELIKSECSLLGDLNADGSFNVLDIVALANIVLSGSCYESEPGSEPETSESICCAADMNGDGWYNVLDVVQLANCVLLGNCTSYQYWEDHE